MSLLLLILAVFLVVFGVVSLLSGSLLWGFVLVIVGLILGGYGREGLR